MDPPPPRQPQPPLIPPAPAVNLSKEDLLNENAILCARIATLESGAPSLSPAASASDGSNKVATPAEKLRMETKKNPEQAKSRLAQLEVSDYHHHNVMSVFCAFTFSFHPPSYFFRPRMPC